MKLRIETICDGISPAIIEREVDLDKSTGLMKLGVVIASIFWVYDPVAVMIIKPLKGVKADEKEG